MRPSPALPPSAPHTPVLVDAVLAALAPRDGGIYVDGTFGAGGYTRRMLDAADCRVWAIDRDPDAIADGSALSDHYGDRLRLRQGSFGAMERILAEDSVSAVDGVALDLGVSSMQIDRPERGFSFRADGPLDMRMGHDGPTAADVVNGEREERLADIIWRLGDERHSRRIARRIAEARRERPITRTVELAEIVRRAIGRRATEPGIDPATRTFQALRIHVNDELGELDRGLAAAERVIRPGGRLAVVSFHSLEDRRVKDFITAGSGRAPRASRHLPELPSTAPRWRPLHRGAVKPSAEEIATNPRARSARLRAAERLDSSQEGSATR